MHYETTVEIDAPQATVWSTLLDVERWPEWTDSVDEVGWVEGTSVAPGSRVRIKQPRMPALVWTVSELEPGTSFTWRNVSPGLATIGTHILKPTAGDRVSVTLGIHQSGVLAWLIGSLSAARTRRYVQMEAEGLKARSEATA